MFVHTAHHHQTDSISMSLYFLISLIACVVVNLTWCRMKDSHLNSWIMSHDVRASITLINEYFIIRNKSVVKRLLTHFTTDTSLLNEWMNNSGDISSRWKRSNLPEILNWTTQRRTSTGCNSILDHSKKKKR